MKLDYYKPIHNKLISYGFKYEDNKYKYEKEYSLDLLIKIHIDDEFLIIDVYDKMLNEKYIPYYLNQSSGTFINDLKEEIEILKEYILNNCFEDIRLRNQLLKAFEEEKDVIIDRPWNQYPDHIVLRKTNLKWFGLFTTIPYTSLNIQKEGTLDIINLKNNPEKINKLIDYKHYFPAYHMNKKYWISVILDKNTDLNILKDLIEESYHLIK